jgi:hypothetical protein
VVLKNAISDPFEIKTGLKQQKGYILEWVIRRMHGNWKCTFINTSRQILGFAEDVDVLGRAIIEVKEAFVQIDTAAAKEGLEINKDKTKFMTVEKINQHGSRLGQNLTMNNYNIEVVQLFKYLGVIVNVENAIEEELQKRMYQATRCFYGLKSLFNSSHLSRTTKLKLYKTIIRPIATYACETWSLTDQQENALNIFEKMLLRRILDTVPDPVGIWRARTNKKLYSIYRDCSIVDF